MALYHIGAFGGSLHGSTKTTTFRRSKSGIVAYDRPDPHTTNRAQGESTATRNKVAMQLSGMMGEYLLPYLKVGSVETKHGSVYNRLMRLMYEQGITDAFKSATRSPLYGKTTMHETGEVIATFLDESGFNFENAWSGFLACQFNDATQAKEGWSAAGCYVVGKFQDGISGYIVSKDGGKITVTALDGRVHNVSIQVMSLKTPQAVTVTGQTDTAIDVSEAAPTESSPKAYYYNKKAALLSIKVDGKKISESFSDAFLCYEPA
jgi:hypothetical protein